MNIDIILSLNIPSGITCGGLNEEKLKRNLRWRKLKIVGWSFSFHAAQYLLQRFSWWTFKANCDSDLNEMLQNCNCPFCLPPPPKKTTLLRSASQDLAKECKSKILGRGRATSRSFSWAIFLRGTLPPTPPPPHWIRYYWTFKDLVTRWNISTTLRFFKRWRSNETFDHFFRQQKGNWEIVQNSQKKSGIFLKCNQIKMWRFYLWIAWNK